MVAVAALVVGDPVWMSGTLQAIVMNYPRLQSAHVVSQAGPAPPSADTVAASSATQARLDEQQRMIGALRVRLASAETEAATLRPRIEKLDEQLKEAAEVVRQRTAALSGVEAELSYVRNQPPIIVAAARQAPPAEVLAPVPRATTSSSQAPAQVRKATEIASAAGVVQIAAPSHAAAVGCAWIESRAEAPLVLEFDRYKDTLEFDHHGTLNAIIAALRSCPRATLEIAGHSDNRGTPKMKTELAERRAELTAKFFEVHGVKAEQVEVVGMADRQPRDSNATEAGRARNRRVELRMQAQK